MKPLDTLGRPLQALRISVTDRCNFRCGYCMPREAFGPDHAFLDREALLSFEEITRLPEYYPTRTETAILRDNAAEIVDLLAPRSALAA